MSDPDPAFVEALESGGLLQDEYPDQMATRSCTCTDEAVCGAHRLYNRYEQLFALFQEANREKRALRQRISALQQIVALALDGMTPQPDGYWYSWDRDNDGLPEPHFRNDPVTPGQQAELDAIRQTNGVEE